MNQERPSARDALLAGIVALLALSVCVPSLFNRDISSESFALELPNPRVVPLGDAGVWLAWLAHAASSALVALFVRRCSGRLSAGLASGLIFAVHPLHAEPLAWGAARAMPLATALALTSCMMWWFWRAGPTVLRRATSLVLLGLSGWLAPAGAFVPICMWGAMDVRGIRRSGTGTKAHLSVRNWPLMLVALVAVLVGVLRKDLPRPPGSVGPEGFAAWLDSFGSMAIPWRLLPDYSPLYKDSGIFSALYGALGLIVLGLLARTLGRRIPALAAGFWWSLLAMTLALGIDRTLRADWAMYVPSIGFAWAAGEAIATLLAMAETSTSPKALRAAYAAILFGVAASYGTKCALQQKAWGSPSGVLELFEALPAPAQGWLALRYARLAEEKEQDAFRLERRADALEGEGRSEPASSLRERASFLRSEASRLFRRAESALLKRESLGSVDAYAEAARGEVFFRAGEYARARDLLAKASQKLSSPKERSHILFILGEIASRAGDLETAIAHYKEAVAADPSNADAYFRLGYALSAKGRTHEATEAFRRAAELRPDNAAFQNALGAIFERALRFSDAERAYMRAVLAEPTREDYRADLEAVRKMIRGRQVDPEAALRAFEEGTALEAQGRLLEAVEAYRRAIAHTQGHHTAHYRAGVCLAAYGGRLKKFNEKKLYLSQAVEHFRAALVLKPGEEIYLFALAHAHSELGQVAEAEEALREILKTNPRSGAAHLELARLYAYALEDLERAKKELEAAEKLGAKPSAEFLQRLEEIETEKKAPPLSEEEKTALEEANAASSEGDILLEAGEASLAAEAYTRAYDALGASNRRSFLERRAHAAAQTAAAWEKAKNLPKALEWYRKALAAAPASVTYAEELRRLELLLGIKTPAVQEREGNREER